MDDEHTKPKEGRFFSLGAKMAIATVLVVVVVAAIAAVGLTRHEREGLLHAKQQGAEMVLGLFIPSVSAALEFEDPIAVQEALDNLARDEEVRWAAVWAGDQKEAMAVVTKGGVADGFVPPRPTGPQALLDADSLTLSRPVTGPAGEPLGMVSVEYALEREAAAFEEVRNLILGASAVTGVIVVLLLAFTTRRMVVAPLARLEAAARKLEAGGRSAVSVGAQDEVGRLAEAFNRMSAVIIEREERIAAANRELGELFDNMRQGIFTIDREGKIGGRQSSAASEIFGREELSGLGAMDLLLDGVDDTSPEHEALQTWLDVVFEMGPDRWEDLQELAPEEVTTHPGTDHARDLRLEFRPFFIDDRLERVMVLATDETEARRIARVAREQESVHEREMNAMRKIVASGTQLFAGFLRGVEKRLERLEELRCDDPEEFNTSEVEEMFRHAHTVKGESRTFGLVELESASARLEDTLSRLRKPRSIRRPTPLDGKELAENLVEVREALAYARLRLVEASPLGEEVLDQVTVANADLSELERLTAAGSADLRKVVSRLTARPFGELAAGFEASVPTWSGALGKRARLEITGANERVPAGLAAVLRSCLTHLVRNSIAHGIESVEERRAAGKDELGHISLKAVNRGSRIEIEVSDDGKGIDEASVLARAEELGLAPSVQSIFEQGLSSRDSVSDLSGRGVGLSAVRFELDDVGYAIEVESDPGKGATFRIAAKRTGSPFSPPGGGTS
jgi:signal transduction histidine kinase